MSTITSDLAATIVETLEAMNVTFDDGDANEHTTAVKGYKWAPRDLDTTVCGVVELPTIQRVALDDAESQIGSRDWLYEFPVVFYIALDEARYAQAEAAQVIEDWVSAIDANPFSADPTVEDARVVSAGPPEIDADQSRPLIVYPTVLQIQKFVV